MWTKTKRTMARLTRQQMVEQVTVTCYRQTETMTRREALAKYKEGMQCCDPGSSEHERYETIYWRLMDGLTKVTDNIDAEY